MPDKSTLEVCLTPGLLPLYPVDDKVVVVIDVLRATTTMCVALDQGADKVIPVDTIENVFPTGEERITFSQENEMEERWRVLILEILLLNS
jgi:hypothetical protein